MSRPAFHRVRAALLRVMGFRRRDEMDRRLSDEVRFHIEMATQQSVRSGMAPDEARREALVAFGGRGRWEESARDAYRSRPLEEMWRDIRYALRGLRSTPAFTFAAVATLALSIGATTSMFSVVSAVLLRDLPYPHPERIAVLCERNLTAGNPCNSINPGNFLSWRDEAKSFEAMAALYEREVSLTGGGGDPMSVRARVTNASIFPMLGARTALGRVFTEDEDRVGGPNVLVLSHALWQQHFGGDPSIVGKTILVNAFDYTVIGVAAPALQLFEPVDVWLPMRFSANHRAAMGRYMRAIGRLRTGATMEEAEREMKSMAARRAVEVPAVNANWTALVMPLRESVVGGSERALWILLGAVAFLLVIACANVANLLLARAADRQREIAVRISLGAAPSRIIRQLLTESLVLSLVS
ncbi:MAG: ABC transporter permease, partial [Gemmatimonadaceae bacterium]